MISYDYEPSESPTALAVESDVVLRAGSITGLSINGDWLVLELADVDILQDQRDGEMSVPAKIAVDTGGAGLRGELPTATDVSGIEVLVFAHSWDAAPGGLAADIEGLWLSCGRTGPAVSVIVEPAGEALQIASLDHLQRSIAEGDTPPGEVTVRVDSGDGWRLVDTEPGMGQPHEVAIMTTQRALDRAADARWFSTRPDVSFDSEVVISLAPAVSGSCPGLVFDGLEINVNRVFGRFEPVPGTGGGCSDDANPIAFTFIVDRETLSTRFVLSVEEQVTCGGCEFAEIAVDLDDEDTLESLLWGSGVLDMVVGGSAPGDGQFNVVRWDGTGGGLLFSAEGWSEQPAWFQSFEDRSEERRVGKECRSRWSPDH